jgi:5'-deoxynucleotidase YfbR-like HD superfamily hydrolase
MPDGTRESDVEHSYHLALSATELAATYFPELDVGLVTQYSLVHDLPELYAGDVWTFGINQEDRDKKEADEAAATERLLKELPPHTAQLLKRYESQSDQEALFVRFVDKMLPAVINYWAKDASTFKIDYNAHDREELHRRTQLWIHELKTRFPEYPFLHHLLERLDETSEDAVYSEG